MALRAMKNIEQRKALLGRGADSANTESYLNAGVVHHAQLGGNTAVAA